MLARQEIAERTPHHLEIGARTMQQHDRGLVRSAFAKLNNMNATVRNIDDATRRWMKTFDARNRDAGERRQQDQVEQDPDG